MNELATKFLISGIWNVGLPSEKVFEELADLRSEDKIYAQGKYGVEYRVSGRQFQLEVGPWKSNHLCGWNSCFLNCKMIVNHNCHICLPKAIEGFNEMRYTKTSSSCQTLYWSIII